MEDGFLKEVVSKGRIAQWVLTVGGMAVCLLGGYQGFLEGQQIVTVILALGSAVFGIEALSKS